MLRGMWTYVQDGMRDLMARGGPVMWPLLALSVLAVAMLFERLWFWSRTNYPGRLKKLAQLTRLLRAGEARAAAALIEHDRTVYGMLTRALLIRGAGDAEAAQAVELQRGRIERFMPTLSTVITVAPMLGILGTVTGIISSFNILADETTTDPRAVSQGIAEALLTTVAGLVIAIVVLFPYNALRAQVDRTLSRMEAMILAAAAGRQTGGVGGHAGDATAPLFGALAEGGGERPR